MIFQRMKVGLSLLATSMRYLIANPVFFLLPLIMVFVIIAMIAMVILLLILGVPIPLDIFTKPGFNYGLLLFYGLMFYSIIFFYVYVVHRLMLPITGYQSSLTQGSINRSYTALLLVFWATLGVIAAMPILFLHGLWTVLYGSMLEILYFLSWPVIPLVLQARYTFAQVIVRSVTIARKMFPEVLLGVIIFHVITWGLYYKQDDDIISILMSYFSPLLMVLESIFIVTAYRYYLDTEECDKILLKNTASKSWQ